MTAGVAYEQLGPLRQALAEAARTDESNAAQAVARFVELRPGIKDTLCARRHHLLAGRRGTGKSTLLHVARQQLRDDGVPVAVIDMERYKGRPFPDVLIEILIALLDEVQPGVRMRTAVRDLKLRAQFRATRRELALLLRDPQSLSKSMERGESTRRGTSAGGSIEVSGGSEIATGTLGASAEALRNSSVSTTASAQYEELKIERLQQIASRLADELTYLVQGNAAKRAIVFIDDFSYVRLRDQADVLDYLHQVAKNTGIWLKVGGVGTRMRPFRNADPPVGMQPSQDIDPLTIDVTLADFSTAQRFLERMMDGIMKPVGQTTAQVFTETGRTRMVLACGGAVARDYVTLTSAAIDAAVERLSKQGAPTPETLVTIQAEDVNLAARQRVNKKEDDELDQDAGPDAQRLRERWRDVCAFVREQGNSAFVLFRQQDLDSAEWGNELRQLENLRLLHRIRDAVPNTPSWRGIKVVVYMVDLGQVAVQRLRTGIPTFWQGSAEFDKLRRAEWVYAPEWHVKLDEKRARQPLPNDAARAERVEPQPLVLFEQPAELDPQDGV